MMNNGTTTEVATAIKKVEATIRELPSGWLWKERGVIFKTAKAVIASFKKEDKESIALGKCAVIRKTNWEPTSLAGEKIIKFLISQA